YGSGRDVRHAHRAAQAQPRREPGVRSRGRMRRGHPGHDPHPQGRARSEGASEAPRQAAPPERLNQHCRMSHQESMTGTPRVRFVHAHPDAQTITTAGTIASPVPDRAGATVLTATRGGGGEVIPAELRHLEGDRAGLARVREQEIAEAMRALGVTTHAFLGGTTRTFEDSGMEWGPDGHA